jgi:hypothetical protein
VDPGNNSESSACYEGEDDEDDEDDKIQKQRDAGGIERQ